MNVRITMVLTALALAAAACSAADSTLSSSDVTDLTASAYKATAAATVRIDPAQASVGVDSTLKLGSYLYDAQGKRLTGLAGMITRWVSSDTTIATVASNGLVRGLRNGAVTITLVAGTASGESQVTVGSGASATTAPPTNSTTTPTSATTTTSQPSSSTGSGLSGLALVSDDFTSYASTASLLQNISSNIGGTGSVTTALYHDGHNAELAQLDQSVLYNGHATLKYNAPGGTSSIPGLWPSLPHAISTMWLRAKIRFSAGFTTTGTLVNSANAYKLLGWGWANNYGSGRLEITNTNQYQLYYYSTLPSTGALTSTPADFASAGNITTEWTDGGWYDYIIEYQLTSPTTSVARVWIARDGSTPVLRATSTSTAAPGATLPQVSSVMLGLNFNQVRTATQSEALWYGQWEVVDGDQHPNPFGLAGNY